MAKTVIVHGPPACGKTRNAIALAAHFGCNHIIDDWDQARHCLTPGALHLTVSCPIPPVSDPADRHVDVVAYEFRTLRFNPRGWCSAAFKAPRPRQQKEPQHG